MKTTLFDKIKTFFAVTIITFLVWLWAEGRNVDDYTVEAVRIKFVVTGQEDVLISPVEEVVEIKYRASTDQRVRFDNYLKKQNGMIEFVIPVDDGAFAGEEMVSIPISLKTRLQDLRQIGELGISVDGVTPESTELVVEKLVTQAVPLKIEYVDLGVKMSQPPTVMPAEVEVHLPAKDARQLEGVTLPVRLTASDIVDAIPNEPASAEVGVELPPALRNRPHVTYSPARVQVNFTISKQTETYTVPTVPIEISAAPTILDRYEFTLPEGQQVIRDLVLEGPADTIEKIKSQSIKVYATVRPPLTELKAGQNFMPVDIIKPSDVQLVSPPSDIYVTVTLRTQPTPVPGGSY